MGAESKLMSVIFIRPLVVNGLISNLNWLSVDKPVDASMLASNFRSIYAAYNGGLHGKNLKYSSFFNGTTGGIGEYQVQFRENTVDTATGHSAAVDQQGVGTAHSHDGFGSSFLDDYAVDIDVTGYRSYGAYQCPSTQRRLEVYSGSATIENMSPTATDNIYTIYLDVPQSVPLGNSVGLSQYRCFAQLEIANPQFHGGLTNPIAYPYVQSDWMYMAVSFGRKNTSTPRTISGVRVHWMLVLPVVS